MKTHQPPNSGGNVIPIPPGSVPEQREIHEDVKPVSLKTPFLKTSIDYSRAWLTQILTAESMAIIKVLGEADYNSSDPNREAINAFHVYTELCQAPDRANPEIQIALGVEAERFRHFKHLAGIKS